jgi:hypothetical protein
MTIISPCVPVSVEMILGEWGLPEWVMNNPEGIQALERRINIQRKVLGRISRKIHPETMDISVSVSESGFWGFANGFHGWWPHTVLTYRMLRKRLQALY